MAISDGQIGWMRKRLFLNAFDLQAVGFTDGTSKTIAYETAGIIAAEVTDVGMGTWDMDTGDFLNGYIRCPYDLDPNFDVGMRVCWSMINSGVDGDAGWIMLFDAIKKGEAIALPATALDTVFVDPTVYVDENGATSATDWFLQWTSRGIVKPTTLGLTYDDVDLGAFLTFKLELDNEAASTSVHFIGLELDYRIHSCTNPNAFDSPLDNKGDT